MNDPSKAVDVLLSLFNRFERHSSLDSFLKICQNRTSNSVVFTPNLNHVRAINSDKTLIESYLSADFLLPDGMPLVWLSRFFLDKELPPISRLTGVDTAEAILRESSTIFVIGSSPITMDKIKEFCAGQGNLVIEFECEHLQFEVGQVDTVSDSLFERLASSEAKFVLVCLGFPKQEILALNLRRYPFKEPKVFFCVGGSLDMLSGKYPRAPKQLQIIGLEWLWRLILDFRRLGPRYLLDFLFLIKVTPELIYRKMTILFGQK